MNNQPDNSTAFPKGFLWGAATAAHQVEGNNTNNDWWEWEKSGQGTEPSGAACNHYALFKEDFQLAKELNNNAHRLSIEWARLEPRPGEYKAEEVKHYRDVLICLKKLGLASFVTLHHYTNPAWFAKMGGFAKKSNLKYFDKYVAFCADNFGDLVDYWLIFNEPNVYAGVSYFLGIWPPQEKNVFSTIRVFLNLAAAHQRAYNIIHQKIPSAFVGATVNLVDFKPAGRGLTDKLLCRILKFIVNDSFYFFTGHHHDFLGINYYRHNKVSWKNLKSALDIRQRSLEEVRKAVTEEKIPGLGWEIYPQGIYEVTKEIYRRFKKPIYITENGTANANDQDRLNFIKDHLFWLQKAIQEGTDIKGYFYWSLMDNYEWAFGFNPKFGLIEVNYQTFERTKKPSAFYYAEICRRNAL